ncbi:TIGR04283 family arsenosugar biosynthesis glycosyltransferase [Nitrospira sp. Nam74]
MPVLNEEQILGKTLLHTLSLSFDEVIVVDGRSGDRTPDLVTSLIQTNPGNLSLLIASRGRACQMNAGAAMSHGDVLVFLHADTQLPPDARGQIEQALVNPACVGGRFDVQFEPETGWGRIISRMMNWRSRWSGIATGDQAIFVRRQCFEQLGGFSNVPIMEDIDFTQRLKRAGHMAALRATVITSYRRWEQRGPVKTIALMWLLRALYWLGISPHALTRMYAHVR